MGASRLAAGAACSRRDYEATHGELEQGSEAEWQAAENGGEPQELKQQPKTFVQSRASEPA